MDLRRTFAPGMGYVALSRVEGLQGLYLNGVNEKTKTGQVKDSGVVFIGLSLSDQILLEHLGFLVL